MFTTVGSDQVIRRFDNPDQIAADVYRLQVKRARVPDLDFTQLETLIIRETKFENSSQIQRLAKLKWLELIQVCQKDGLPLDSFFIHQSRIQQISRLLLVECQLTTIPELRLPNLSSLNLSRNNLESMGTLRCPALYALDLSWNRLKELPHLECPILNELSICHNQIRVFSQPIPKLYNLDCSYNQIRKISLYCKNRLDCSGNPISRLSCPNLKLVIFRETKLVKIDNGRNFFTNRVLPAAFYRKIRVEVVYSKFEIAAINSETCAHEDQFGTNLLASLI